MELIDKKASKYNEMVNFQGRFRELLEGIINEDTALSCRGF